eukprot:CAMPEP_0185207396 /NCGR_PEP_ID=MMETSP1140-20130426/60184_1 /TAXON_ID=298111 /ORGANISM="Pavlova sp., Strain CCMP459" /LENGTH=262 /DNA_ID=CAMNT_0027775081 /DNA_START=122 /DNA_END=909 /DNA_ORIENTATION=-
MKLCFSGSSVVARTITAGWNGASPGAIIRHDPVLPGDSRARNVMIDAKLAEERRKDVPAQRIELPVNLVHKTEKGCGVVDLADPGCAVNVRAGPRVEEVRGPALAPPRQLRVVRRRAPAPEHAVPEADGQVPLLSDAHKLEIAEHPLRLCQLRGRWWRGGVLAVLAAAHEEAHHAALHVHCIVRLVCWLTTLPRVRAGIVGGEVALLRLPEQGHAEAALGVHVRAKGECPGGDLYQMSGAGSGGDPVVVLSASRLLSSSALE